MKKLLLSFILTLFMSYGFSQTKQDTITIKKGFGTYYIQNGKMLKPKQLLELTKSNPVAHEVMLKAKKNQTPAVIFGGIGGFCIGYSLGSLVSGSDVNWPLLGAGIGLSAISIPFSSAYTKHTTAAVKAYNEGLQQKSYRKVRLESMIGAHGLGLRATF
jgi:hypothetical protein